MTQAAGATVRDPRTDRPSNLQVRYRRLRASNQVGNFPSSDRIETLLRPYDNEGHNDTSASQRIVAALRLSSPRFASDQPTQTDYAHCHVPLGVFLFYFDDMIRRTRGTSRQDTKLKARGTGIRPGIESSGNLKLSNQTYHDLVSLQAAPSGTAQRRQ